MSDNDPQILGVFGVSLAPDGGQQVAVADDLADVARQMGQDIILLGRQTNGFACASDVAAFQVDDHLARRQRPRRFSARRLAQIGAQPGQKFTDAEGLLDIVIGAQIKSRDLLGLLVPRRQDYDGASVEFPGAGQHVLAVHIGQT